MNFFYFKIAYRNLIKRRTYAIINILGLAIGLACAIFIYLYVNDELAYDKYHPHSKRTYRIVNTHNFGGIGEESSSSPCPLGPAIKNRFEGQIEHFTRVYNNWSTPYFIRYQDVSFKEKRFFFVDSSIFNVFQIPFYRGNPETALSESGNVVITKSTARRYFGHEDPIGKSIRFNDRLSFLITGIIEDSPSQTHFKYDFLASISSLKLMYRGKMPETWVWNPFWTYIVLKDCKYKSQIESGLKAFVDDHFFDAEKDNISLSLQALEDIHLRSSLDYEIEANGNITYIRILILTGLFFLLIAIINFINLSTAMAGKRAKEIGVKKISGGQSLQLIAQFMIESLIISLIALFIAMTIVEILLPLFNDFTSKNFFNSDLITGKLLGVLFLLWISTSFLSGLYPSIYLSAFNPLRILRGTLINRKRGSTLLRKALVIIQLSISITLITASLMTFKQLQFLDNIDLGFRKANIILLPVNENPIISHYEAFKADLLKQKEISHVTAVDYIPGTAHNSHEFCPEGTAPDKWVFFPALVVREDFLECFDIDIVCGRPYMNENKTDPMQGILINEAMVSHMGWKSNEEALGKRFNSLSGKEKVIGIFKNFNANSLHEKAGPMVLNMKEDQWQINYFTDFIAIRYSPGSLKTTLKKTEEIWNYYCPQRPFEYKIHEEEIRNLYNEEDVLSKFTAVLSILIVIVAALGLYGLASFTAEQRTKETGIRKVLGSSVLNIISLITRDFIILTGISCLIALPLSFLVLQNWLSGFAYHINFSWPVFIISSLSAIALTFLITGLKAFTTARINPVETLKYE